MKHAEGNVPGQTLWKVCLLEAAHTQRPQCAVARQVPPYTLTPLQDTWSSSSSAHPYTSPVSTTVCFSCLETLPYPDWSLVQTVYTSQVILKVAALVK